MNQEVKILNVGKLAFGDRFPDLYEISGRFDSLKIRNRIGTLNWKGSGYKPDVDFSMAFTSDELLLKYYITEEWFKAEKTESNEAVYEDSCVEFFVSPGDDGIYYNFEFNGIGTCLMGSGKGRHNRIKAPPEIISLVRRKSSAGTESICERSGRFSWNITMALPVKVFFQHQIIELAGKTFRANFYKCGDKLSMPHYLTWNPVLTEKPDFHRPEFFGILKFNN
jgi:hypothetical protein